MKAKSTIIRETAVDQPPATAENITSGSEPDPTLGEVLSAPNTSSRCPDIGHQVECLEAPHTCVSPAIPPLAVPSFLKDAFDSSQSNSIVVYQCSHCGGMTHRLKSDFEEHRRVAACGGRAVRIDMTMEDDNPGAEVGPTTNAHSASLPPSPDSQLVASPPTTVIDPTPAPPIFGTSCPFKMHSPVDINTIPLDIGPPQTAINAVFDLPVPPTVWFLIEATVHDPTGFSAQVWFDTFTTSGLLALRVPRTTPSATLLLAFKSELRRQMMFAYLSSHMQVYGLSSVSRDERNIALTQFDSQLSLPYITHAFHHQRGPEDLQALISRAPPSRIPPPSLFLIGKANRQQWVAAHGGGHNAWKADFFEWHIWPVRFGAPGKIPLRRLDVIEFTLGWLDTWLSSDPVAQSSFEYQRLRVAMHAYQHPGPGIVPSDFFALLLQTVDGPYEAVLRRIARACRTLDIAAGKPCNKTRSLRRYESFGFVMDSVVWRLELELGSDRPEYPVPQGEDLQRLKR